MRRVLFFTLTMGALGALGYLVWTKSAPAQNKPAKAAETQPVKVDEPPVVTPSAPVTQLPIGQVVLFSSGVGYFQREGQIEGTARVDLSFPVTDINDLIKSMVLRDLDGG